MTRALICSSLLIYPSKLLIRHITISTCVNYCLKYWSVKGLFYSSLTHYWGEDQWFSPFRFLLTRRLMIFGLTTEKTFNNLLIFPLSLTATYVKSLSFNTSWACDFSLKNLQSLAKILKLEGKALNCCLLAVVERCAPEYPLPLSHEINNGHHVNQKNTSKKMQQREWICLLWGKQALLKPTIVHL